ncbi:MAG TPA: hypothetical protein VIO64_09515 [Pseudobacteroides sp.]|uniref:hypothetical protein n=1 Tax=Pseudobacteroides sp. TaxID=1968840 RepID=UPI002F95B97C
MEPGGVEVYYPHQDDSGVKKNKISFDLSKALADITRIAVILTEDQGAGFIKVQNLKASVYRTPYNCKLFIEIRVLLAIQKKKERLCQ